MPCFHPLKGYVSGKTGALTFKPREALKSADGSHLVHLTVNCRKCVGCLTRRAREYSLRASHEARLHKNNLFVTLTYDDKNLPDNKGLKRSHIQDFVKVLRERIRREYNHTGIRILYCGEYGTRGTKRPHYHIILFNMPVDFDLRCKINFSHNKRKEYTSKIIYESWNKRGIVNIQKANSATCAYVAQYVTKKLQSLDKDVVFGRESEFIQGSTRPALGFKWLFEASNGWNVFRMFESARVPLYRDDGKIDYVYPPRYYVDKFCEIFDNFKSVFKKRLYESVRPFIEVDNYEDKLYTYEYVMLDRVSKKLVRRNLCL